MVFRHQVHQQCWAYVRSMVNFHGRDERFHSNEYARLEIAMLEQASSLHTKAVKIAACDHEARLIISANREIALQTPIRGCHQVSPDQTNLQNLRQPCEGSP